MLVFGVVTSCLILKKRIFKQLDQNTNTSYQYIQLQFQASLNIESSASGSLEWPQGQQNIWQGIKLPKSAKLH